ncbi:MAG TPA: cytochrome c peroxidase [Polyangiaceae bacterium]|nr:cytochrome c peroxidase [Polyangiaceae bacterium]
MRSHAFLLVALTTSLVASCTPSKEQSQVAPSASASAPAAPAAFDPSMLAALQPLPKTADGATPASADRVTLGKMLYFEARLSKNHDVSCNTCHKLDAFGVDGTPTSEGHRKQHGNRNAPTVLNAAIEFRQFWDGRAADVEEQATGPIVNPVEMASDEKRVVETLSSMPEYVDAFKKAFPGDKAAITLKNVGVAIGAFERKLLTPSRFDAYLAGDHKALTEAELAGAAKFVQTGCPTCHLGADVGGSLYQKAGLVKPWPSQTDQGRFTVTKQDTDRMMFKVPSLRNVEKTAPYFHDGSVAILDEAVRMMARHQLGKELDDADIKSIVAFLKTLTASPAADLAAPPTLPKSTATTPKPDPK